MINNQICCLINITINYVQYCCGFPIVFIRLCPKSFVQMKHENRELWPQIDRMSLTVHQRRIFPVKTVPSVAIERSIVYCMFRSLHNYNHICTVTS